MQAVFLVRNERRFYLTLPTDMVGWRTSSIRRESELSKVCYGSLSSSVVVSGLLCLDTECQEMSLVSNNGLLMSRLVYIRI